MESLRLGRDVRFLLAVVGGGAIRIGREIARRHLRHLETVAINCDDRVQALDDFDRRVCLGWNGGADDPHGSPLVAAQHARAAEPALERLFDGATFVTVVASLGGASGTGALPSVLEAAARNSEFVSAFVVKPFANEGDRRATAHRALAHLHFVASFVEKQERGSATLNVLDNEAFAHAHPGVPFSAVNREWARVVANHIEQQYLVPVEAAIEARRLAAPPEFSGPPIVPPELAPSVEVSPSPSGLSRMSLPPLAAVPAFFGPYDQPDAEVTFEVVQARSPLAP